MRSIYASDLLDIWELGQTQNPVQRGLLLLSACWPEKRPEDLARLPIGERDAKLLCLREELFGPNLSGLARCPHCSQCIETSFKINEIRAIPATSAAEDPRMILLRRDGYELDLRLPNSKDLMAISGIDHTRAMQALIESCIAKATHEGIEISAEALPENVLEAVAHKMVEEDPQAHVDLDLTCPECGHRWQVPFDILSFLWTELDAWAYRTIQDVHSLASAYGWSEAEILAMSSQKREAYLELVGR